MKKCILIYLVLLIFTLPARAQFNNQLGINYQAVARDASGEIISEKVILLRAALLVGGPEGKNVYSEVHQVTTGKSGLFQLVIGRGDILSGEYAEVPWAEKNIWLEMSIAENKGKPFTTIGASQLLAVPYAYHAGSAETIHLHDESDEKRRCPITGLPFWSVLGNSNVTDDCHFIGTVIDEDLIFKTNNIERLRITADGTLNVIGQFNIDGDLNVTGSGEFGKDLVITHNTTTDSLKVFSHTQIEGTTTLEGQTETLGRLIVNGGADGSQSDQNSYPLLVKGSKQGIAIEVNPATESNLESGRGNNYVSFWKNDQMTGRIEGMNTVDLDPTGIVSLIKTLVSNPPSGVSYNFGQLPVNVIPTVDVDVDVDWGIFLDVGVDVGFSDLSLSDPFNNLSNELLNYIRNPTGGPAALIWNKFTSIACDPQTGLFTQTVGQEAATNFKSQIFSNYTLDILTNSISVFGSIAQLVTSAASVFDPEDIVSQAIALVVDISNLVIVGSYADINRGVAYESGSGDYAEWLLRADTKEVIHSGDVVGVIGGKISKKFLHADRFMVISTAPIVLGNMPDDPNREAGMEKVAFLGQVPVKVRGAVQVGDYLLPSGDGDGLAIAVSPLHMKARDYQRIIGVAWEASNGNNFINMINTAVGINQNDTGKLIEEMQMVINTMQLALKELKPDYEPYLFETEETAMPRPKSLDYTVSATHSSQMEKYFDGKSYETREEMLRDVKLVLQKKANIDINEYPVIAHIFDHPEQARELTAYYGQIAYALQSVLAQSKR